MFLWAFKMNKKLIFFPLFIIIALILVYALISSDYFKSQHDIAITNIVVSKVEVTQGEVLEITITSRNWGSVPEDFNATCYISTTEIGTQEVTNLAPNTEKNVVFSYDTENLPVANYEIRAEVSVVYGETSIEDNTHTDGTIKVRSAPTGLEALRVSPPKSFAQVGQDFTVNIEATDIADLYAWELKLEWNTTILELVETLEGEFLKNGGTTFFTYAKNETTGSIKADCTLLGDLPGVNGNGTLAVFKFNTKGSGDCPLTLYDTIMLNSFEQPISHSSFSGSFEEGQWTTF